MSKERKKRKDKSLECEVFQKHFKHSGRFVSKVEVPKKFRKDKHKNRIYSEE